MIVGFTASSFDLLHAGHIAMLREAKEHCDWLICGLQVDPSVERQQKNQPVQTLVERWTQLQAVKYVDEIIPYQYEEDLEDIMKMFHIDRRIVGSEYKERHFTGKELCTQLGIDIYYNRRDHRFSSSDLRHRVAQTELKKND